MSSINYPTEAELLAAGAQFGHQRSRWNPKMSQYIFGEKNGIHIIDASKTLDSLKKAAEFLEKISATGNVLFVGTKKQASNIIRENAIRSGAYFIDQRWAGGLFTNFSMIKQSLKRLRSLEKGFEEGVVDRTKYEVSLMKKEWQNLNRLYSGIKTLETKPVAMVVLDITYEKSAVKEARQLGIPLVGIVDTNCDPDLVNYVIPANDDAVKPIKMIMTSLADAVLSGNKGNGVKHSLKDYSSVEVKITKKEDSRVEGERIQIVSEGGDTIKVAERDTKFASPKVSSGRFSKGILERVKDSKVEVKEKKETGDKDKLVKKDVDQPKTSAAKTNLPKVDKQEKKVVAKTTPKKAVAKTVKKSESKPAAKKTATKKATK